MSKLTAGLNPLPNVLNDDLRNVMDKSDSFHEGQRK